MQSIVGYWNHKNGKIETARAESASEVAKKVEYAQLQCRFWSQDKDACEPMKPCDRTGFFAVAKGEAPNGRFVFGWKCGAATRAQAEADAIRVCASSCAVHAVSTSELRK